MPRIARKMFVAAPCHEVWQLANRFDKWHPKLRETPGGPEMDPELVVKIITRDDQGMELSYTMPEPPFPIANHSARIQVRPQSSQSCYVEWSADFTADPAVLHDLEDELGDDVYRAALDKLATAAQDAQVGNANQ